MSLFSGFPSLQQYFDVEIFRSPPCPAVCTLRGLKPKIFAIYIIQARCRTRSRCPAGSKMFPPLSNHSPARRRQRKPKNCRPIVCSARWGSWLNTLSLRAASHQIFPSVTCHAMLSGYYGILWSLNIIRMYYNTQYGRTTTSLRRCTRPTCWRTRTARWSAPRSTSTSAPSATTPATRWAQGYGHTCTDVTYLCVVLVKYIYNRLFDHAFFIKSELNNSFVLPRLTQWSTVLTILSNWENRLNLRRSGERTGEQI